jgi:hypothetical protein
MFPVRRYISSPEIYPIKPRRMVAVPWSLTFRRDQPAKIYNILCRKAPDCHPDASYLKVLEHKMPSICGGGEVAT